MGTKQFSVFEPFSDLLFMISHHRGENVNIV
jgi:hypothetical protein